MIKQVTQTLKSMKDTINFLKESENHQSDCMAGVVEQIHLINLMLNEYPNSNLTKDTLSY